MNTRTAEFKKGKELFLASLFAYILRSYTKNEYAICIPIRDRGTDVFVREIDERKRRIIMHPLEVCEMPERYLSKGGMPDDLAQAVFDFVRKTKLKRYPASVDCLLVWIEMTANRHLDLVRCRSLFDSEPGIPFVQIVGFGTGRDDILNVASLHSKDATDHFCVEYHYNAPDAS